ncbi:MAG TPA: FHA domain-containing protein [Vicinamibacterales bacterium]|nr:FHA domain-containing protein [Vicinamibacterales bacterium]
MAPELAVHQTEAPRRSARDVIEAVLENMRTNLEPLKYSTLAPSRYLVYLHPAEYARIEGIIPLLQRETARALAEELNRLNHRSTMRRYLDRLFGAEPDVQNPAVEWQIEFLRDADNELQEGDILMDSELLLPAPVEFGAGERTRRVTTMRAGQRTTTTRKETVERLVTAATASPFARLRYDDNSGTHAFDIVKDSITIGRGGIAYRVDVRIEASVDVSREHLRIRRDPTTGRFFAIDLSSLGTTVDGKRLPRGYDEADGGKRENGTETPLPDRARIGMADTVFLDFEVLTR